MCWWYASVSWEKHELTWFYVIFYCLTNHNNLFRIDASLVNVFSDDLDESKIKQDDDEDVSMSSIPESSKKATPVSLVPTERTEGGEESEEGDKLPFPSSSDLNTRLRRIITSFQRNHKRMLIKNAQRVKVN